MFEQAFKRTYRGFDSEAEAFNWVEQEVDDPCVDNFRLAYLDDEAALQEYEERCRRGCCGSFDTTVEIAGRPAYIGCNYGH